MVRGEIKIIIKRALKELQREKILPEFPLPEIFVEQPEEREHGDYSSNITLRLAKIIKRNPMETAKALEERIRNSAPRLFDRIEVAEPGFINFFLSKEYLQKQAGKILKFGNTFGQLNAGRGKKANIEFISANPTGPLHIGNGRNAFAGDAIANVMAAAGYHVTREYYVNDAKNSNQIIELGKTAIGEGTVYLNDYLRQKIKNQKSKIKNIIKKYKNDREKMYREAGFLLAGAIQKDTRRFLEKKLKIKMDKWVSEEDYLYKRGRIQQMFRWLQKNGLVYQKDGAWWVKTSQFGDEKDWVVIRENGQPTYLLSDIAYHKDKFDRGFQRVIDIWGADHQAHVSKMKAAANMLGYKGALDILILQLVTLKGGEKLSKRKGHIITLEELVDEIGLDVARFFYLQRSLDSHMQLDLAAAKERSEKNPVYYVQYAHARIWSIGKKFKMHNAKIKMTNQNVALLSHPSELILIKQLLRLPEVVEDTAKDYQIQRLPQYAVDLAGAFHQFYRDCRVISDDKELTQARLALVLATKTVLKNTLGLMGISAPKRM